MTVQEIIDEAKLDFPDESDLRALSDLQAVDDDICFRLPVFWSREDISLVAGTKEYLLPAGTNRVRAARYVKSATSSRKLEARHIDWFDEYDDNWRDLAPGAPTEYYVDIAGGTIGFHPTPNATTSTYPKATIDVSKRRTLALSPSPTDLGNSLPSYRAWVEGLRFRMALRTQDSRLDYYRQMFDYEMAALDLAMRGSAEFTPHVRMDTPLRQHRRRV